MGILVIAIISWIVAIFLIVIDRAEVAKAKQAGNHLESKHGHLYIQLFMVSTLATFVLAMFMASACAYEVNSENNLVHKREAILKKVELKTTCTDSHCIIDAIREYNMGVTALRMGSSNIMIKGLMPSSNRLDLMEYSIITDENHTGHTDQLVESS